jgi:predicted tellurium resistance membrane protein TerC
MHDLFTLENLIALLTLTALEVVLGIDNIVFLAILSGKLPPEKRARARRIGLSMAMIMRVLLLMGIKWVMGLTEPLFAVVAQKVSGRDLILLAGGLFLIGKSVREIHERMEGAAAHGEAGPRAVAVSFAGVVTQIALIDLVFSLDSVITAVGMANRLSIMIVAVIVAILIMMAFAGAVSDFVERHPTIKMLALAFLLLIGVMLIAEGLHHHINRGYIYFAMAFALFVEFLNIRTTRRPHAPAG